jgi:ferredoxin-nitrite reductase
MTGASRKCLRKPQKKLAFPLRYLPLEACEPSPRSPNTATSASTRSRTANTTSASSLRSAACHGFANARPRRHRRPNSAAVKSASPSGKTSSSPVFPEEKSPGRHRPPSKPPDSTTATTAITGGLIACTGSRGCKYAAADTKANAILLGEHLSSAHDPCRPSPSTSTSPAVTTPAPSTTSATSV